MNRIQTALEHYKRSQVGQGQAVGPVSSDISPPTGQFVYTHTKKNSPSPSALVAHRVLTGMAEGAYLEAYKILRTQILHRLRERNWQVIGVTSPGAGEGKTLVSVNLSISIAMEQNHTALLIDGNLRNPQVHQVFGFENRGLADYLMEQIPFSDLLVHPQIDRLVVLPAGGPIKNSVEMLTLPKMTALIDEVRTRYPTRVIIVDLPALLDTADVLGLGPRLDAVLLVVEEGRTTEKDVEKSLLRLDGTLPLLGTVLNKAGRGSQ